MNTYLNSDALVDKSISQEKLSEDVQQKLSKADSIEELSTDEINQILE